MRRLLALASFALVLTTVSSIADEPIIINVYEGGSLHLSGDEFRSEIINCTIETNEGKIIEGSHNGFFNFYCSYSQNKVGIDIGGKWNIRTFLDNGEVHEKKFIVIVTREVNIKPAKIIELISGEWATVWFDDNDTEIISCELKSKTAPVDKNYNLLNGNYKNIERYHQCGVRMIAETNDIWELTRKFNEFVMDVNEIEIRVFPNSDNKKVVHHLFDLGKDASLIVKESVVFCLFTKPDGSTTEIQYGDCRLQIKKVNNFHRGVWKATYAVPGKMELNVMEFHVDTWDQDALNGTLIRGNNGEIHLLCRAGVPTLKFCSFIKPDRQVIHVPVGTGTDDYEYYGEGFSESEYGISRNYADCGLTIKKPSASDFGLWTCELGIKKDSETNVRGTIINVFRSRSEPTYTSSASKVYVERGDSFKIRCKINAMLDYCWLTSPNGTIYGVLPDSPSGSDLEYNGKGFGMGDCGAIIRNANSTDNGKWICHMGISGKREIEEVVPVQVTDSYLIAEKETVYGGSTAKLQVRTFIEVDGALKYCRWVRPNGHGINQNDSLRYETKMGLNECELRILETVPEDFGTWTCFALLTGSINSEQKTTVELKSVVEEIGTAKMLSIILGSGLLVLTLLSVILTGIYIRRRREFERSIKKPPPYDPEFYNKMPEHIKPKYNDFTTTVN